MMPIPVCKYSFDYAARSPCRSTPPHLSLFSFVWSRPLRDRPVHTLQSLANNSLRSRVVDFTHSRTATLISQRWPGSVRATPKLRVCERACASTRSAEACATCAAPSRVSGCREMRSLRLSASCPEGGEPNGAQL